MFFPRGKKVLSSPLLTKRAEKDMPQLQKNVAHILTCMCLVI